MTQVAIGPPKLCPKCGFMRPRSDFYARKYKGAIYASALCKTHEKERSAAWQKENPEKVKEHRKQTYIRLLSDPERAAIRRDQGREQRRRKYGITPDRYRPTHMKKVEAKGKAKRLPVEPFAQWLETLGESSTDIAMVTGLDDRQVRTYLTRSRDILLDVADRALLHAATGVQLSDLWPDLLEAA